MKKSSFLLIACLTAIVSCAPGKYIAPGLLEEVRDVAIISPLTYIEYVDEMGLNAYDDSLSTECARLITEALVQSSLPTGAEFTAGLSDEDTTCRETIAYLCDVDPKHAGELPFPELSSLLREQGARYGILVFANGFSCDRTRYKKDLAIGVGIAILTAVLSLGTITVYSIPYKSEMHTWIGILDAETERLVYFNSRDEKDADPTKPRHVTDHINKLLKDFEPAVSY